MWTDEVAAALNTPAEQQRARAVADVPPGQWRAAISAARDQLGLNFFDWLSAVDEGDEGMRVVAHLWSVEAKRGLLLRTLVADGQLESIVDIYPGAAWHERETHEMFGLGFDGHPGLTPLLLAEEFQGHPLRKDFVLAARVAKPWPGAKEPGGGHGGAKKRQPMRPPGVPAPGEWGPASEPSEPREASEPSEANEDGE